MNISYNWLREFLDTLLPPHELAARLTGVGLAVESVHEVGKDFIFDIDLTSNRPDCLSHLGVAREVAVIEDSVIRLPSSPVERSAGTTSDYVTVDIADPDLCPRYSARVVRGVKIAPSPKWMVERLEAIGQRSVNNVADITNFVMHELGQPLHAFDLAKLRGPRIIVRRAAKGERLWTLDGVERELDEEMLVIADKDHPVAVAGVMGGEGSEISDETVDVLIESAHFTPGSVRKTSKRLGLHTEASHRFERGADPEGVLRAQERCVALITEIAGGEATAEPIDNYPRRLIRPEVTLRPERVRALTGLSVDEGKILGLLNALGFITTSRSEASEAEINIRDERLEDLHLASHSAFSFAVPSWRFDVEREEDLVEEVARHVGFDKIQSELPAAQAAGDYQPAELRKRALRSALSSAGFDEAINFSFIDASNDDRFELLDGLVANADSAERFVTLNNSIVEGATRMRATLLPGLLQSVRHNFNHGNRDVGLFELGHVFAANQSSGDLPHEVESFALVLTGGATEESRAEVSRSLDFFDLKGAIEDAIDAMHLPALSFEAAHVEHLREGQSARITLDGALIGTAGRLTEDLVTSYKFRQPVFVAELNLSILLSREAEAPRYVPLAKYPSIVRDISLLLDRGVSYSQIVAAISREQIEDCRAVMLVGVYEGSNIPEGKKSLTLRLEYRADDRTLRDEDVEAFHQKIVSLLGAEFGAEIRL
jgi:phenylalanyl-tRNA synthetase beta chain